jgi:hypothetical protein
MLMRVLITNNTLAVRAGSELYVRDLAAGLIERGHTPIAYSTRLGEVAEELRAATVPVIDDLRLLAVPPDIIHGQHHVETMTALLHFPAVPAVYFCHGWMPWEEAPPCFPRILRYVAIDFTCRDRLLFEHAIPEDQIRVLHNFADLEKFKPRPPLPSSPRRALVFSNYASENYSLAAVREACNRANISLDVLGSLAGNATARPEEILGSYDIIFAKGRSAIEAIAVGAAVILCETDRVGQMVTTDEFDRLRSLNFGIRAIQLPIDAETVSQEIARYDPADAAEVSRRLRAVAGRDETMDEIISLYEEVIAQHRAAAPIDLRDEERAAAAYLRWLAPRLKERDQLYGQIARLSGQLEEKASEIERITSSLGWRLVNLFGPIKHRLLLPVWKRLKKPFARPDA